MVVGSSSRQHQGEGGSKGRETSFSFQYQTEVNKCAFYVCVHAFKEVFTRAISCPPIFTFTAAITVIRTIKNINLELQPLPQSMTLQPPCPLPSTIERPTQLLNVNTGDVLTAAGGAILAASPPDGTHRPTSSVYFVPSSLAAVSATVAAAAVVAASTASAAFIDIAAVFAGNSLKRGKYNRKFSGNVNGLDSG